MLTALLLLVPFLFALICLLIKNEQVKYAALTGTIIELAIGIYAYSQFGINNISNYFLDITWIGSLGIHFKIDMDGISLILVLLSVILLPFIILSTFRHNYPNASAFYSLLLFMQAALIGVFVSMDAFLFYVFYELALIPIYFICGFWGGKNRVRVTLKFFIYTLAGSLLMLVALIFLYLKTPSPHSFDITAFYHLPLSVTEQSFIFWAFFIAFAIKIPIFPFHTWQPDTYTEAPAAGTMMLAGIMLKMGIYGLIRFVLPIVPAAVQQWDTLALILCISGIVYGSVIAIRQQDLKTFIAYSSIAHVGLIAAGVFTLSQQGLQGAVIQMFNHGINVVALFFMIDMIEMQTGTRIRNELGGIAGRSKMFSAFFMIVLLGAVGLPLTNGFVGEFFLLFGIFTISPVAAGIAGLTIILGAVYFLRMYRDVFFGELNSVSIKMNSSPGRDQYIVLLGSAALILVVGIFPQWILSVSQASVNNLLHLVQTHSGF